MPNETAHNVGDWMRATSLFAVPAAVGKGLAMMGYDTPGAGALLLLSGLAFGAWALQTWHPSRHWQQSLRRSLRLPLLAAGSLAVIAVPMMLWSAAPKRGLEPAPAPTVARDNGTVTPPDKLPSTTSTTPAASVAPKTEDTRPRPAAHEPKVTSTSGSLISIKMRLDQRASLDPEQPPFYRVDVTNHGEAALIGPKLSMMTIRAWQPSSKLFVETPMKFVGVIPLRLEDEEVFPGASTAWLPGEILDKNSGFYTWRTTFRFEALGVPPIDLPAICVVLQPRKREVPCPLSPGH